MAEIRKEKARLFGLISIAVVVALHVNSVIKYFPSDILSLLITTVMFIFLPLLPAILCVNGKNPLLTVGGALSFIPLLLYVIDEACCTPYRGGGTPMTHVLLVMYGLPLVCAGMLVTKVILHIDGIKIIQPDKKQEK